MLFVIASLFFARCTSELFSTAGFARAVPFGMTKRFPAHENESSPRWPHISRKTAWTPDVWPFLSFPSHL
jgi:hypothetical protein